MIFALFLKGIICENFGALENTCNAYKECNWLYKKFSSGNNEILGFFFNSLEKRSTNYVNIKFDIKKIIYKNKIIKDLEKSKKKHFLWNKLSKIRIENNYKESYELRNFNNGYYLNHFYSSSFNPDFLRTQKEKSLEKYLGKLGKEMYKEEENRNNNLIKKFTKSTYILSTMTMIDNLLSKDFKEVFKKMKKIEITKPEEEINLLINKTIRRKRLKYLAQKDDNKPRNSSAFIKRRNVNGNITVYKKTNRFIYPKSISSIRNNNIKRKYLSTMKLKEINNSMQNDTFEKSNISNININNNSTYKNQNNNNRNLRLNRPKNYSVDLSQNYLNKKKLNHRMNSEKVIKYYDDKFEFSKNFFKKRQAIDKYCDKEIDFHKRLLYSKKYEILKVPYEINKNEIFESAEREFDYKLKNEIAKLSKKNISNLLNQNELIKNEFNKKNKIGLQLEGIDDKKEFYNAFERTLIKYRKEREKRKKIRELNESGKIQRINEEKVKTLNYEYEQILEKAKKMEKQRRKLILKSSK